MKNLSTALLNPSIPLSRGCSKEEIEKTVKNNILNLVPKATNFVCEWVDNKLRVFYQG